MAKLKKPFNLQTAFGEYHLTEQIGEGGAGRVYGGVDVTNAPVAIKILASTASDKRRRFKNEIAFLARNQHLNIVTVIDHGFAAQESHTGPFYVMRRYSGNLRNSMARGLSPDQAIAVLSKVLDGVEAAHLQKVIHRDLKPENILMNGVNEIAVADFGVASFTEDQLVTLVETAPTQRLANFLYAAPEQRVAGKPISPTADIYALGLITNELFTGNVPHGTDYQSIKSVAGDFGFLDAIVAQMIKQNPLERPASILEVKQLIQKYREQAVSLQRLSEINKTVIKVGEIDEPLAYEPPVLVDANWDNRRLTLTLDRNVTPDWIAALRNMGSHRSMMGASPRDFDFRGETAIVDVDEHAAQGVIDYFKEWLPRATQTLRNRLEAAARQEEGRRQQQLRQEREAEERRLRVNRSLKI